MNILLEKVFVRVKIKYPIFQKWLLIAEDGTVILSFKAGDHRSLIREKTPDHEIRSIYRTYEIPLYMLTH